MVPMFTEEKREKKIYGPRLRDRDDHGKVISCAINRVFPNRARLPSNVSCTAIPINAMMSPGSAHRNMFEVKFGANHASRQHIFMHHKRTAA
jgi:hypothetical protein